MGNAWDYAEPGPARPRALAALAKAGDNVPSLRELVTVHRLRATLMLREALEVALANESTGLMFRVEDVVAIEETNVAADGRLRGWRIYLRGGAVVTVSERGDVLISNGRSR